MIFTNCGEGHYDVYSSIITIENKSSQDLNVRFSPEKIQIDKDTQIYGYKAVDVKKGESVSFTVTYKQYVPPGYASDCEEKGPNPNDNVKKIIFSKMDTKELVKEVNLNSQNRLFIDEDRSLCNFILKITDELLSIKGE
jgi:hypothetical protein